MHKLGLLTCSIFLSFITVSAQGLPAGTVLEVRLSRDTGSRISHQGDPIEATVIAPIAAEGRMLVPQGSRLWGTIADATAIGSGLKHSTATIAYSFSTLQLPDGAAIPVTTQLVEVETAKEKVDGSGTVHGIHPIVSLFSGLAFFMVPLLMVNPAIGVPAWGLKSLVVPSSNPEIEFPKGTELLLRLTAAVSLPASSTGYGRPAQAFSRGDLTEIELRLRNSARRAYLGSRPSDIVNVLLIGSRDQIERAFHASGWSQSQRKSPMSLYRMYHALCKRHGYQSAPMNALTLNGVASAFVQQKSLDTVQKRHHVRLWQYPGRTDMWLGAAAEDIGFRFKLTHWTHSTDPHIDRERGKILNDLAFTGCVAAAALLSRSSADSSEHPKAEHPIVTDGGVAVMRLTDCVHPNPMAGTETFASRRGVRLVATATALGDALVRSNILFTTYNTLNLLAKDRAEPTSTRAPMLNVESRGSDWLASTRPAQAGSGQ